MIFLRVLFFVLNKTEKLDDILTEFAHNGIGGATILSSTGMARVLSSHTDDDDIPFLGSVRAFLNPDRKKSNTIFAVLNDEQVNTAVEVIEKTVGNLNHKDTGIVFTFPVDFVKGLPQSE